MRETQKRDFTILQHNQNWEIPTIFRRKKFENNNTNEKLRVAVKKEDYLELKQLNKYQSDFFVLVVLTIVTYIFILDSYLRLDLKSGLVFNTVIQAVWGFIGYQFIKRSVLPKEVYGLTLTNWKNHSKEAIIWSLGFILVAVCLKWFLITFIPTFHGTPLLSFRVFYTLGWFACFQMIGCYILLVPAQELISRSLLQGSLMHTFSGKHATTKAILITTIVFSALHLITSIWLAYTVFLPSIFWGILFAKQRSIIGVSISHLILGVFFLYFEYLPIADRIHF